MHNATKYIFKLKAIVGNELRSLKLPNFKPGTLAC